MKKEHLILFAIFIVVLQFRLLFAFQTPYLSSDDAYYNLRQTEHISENLKPMIFDALSYGGRFIIDSHLLHYALAALNLILPAVFVFKIFPEILFASLIFIVYAIARKVTENSTAAMFAAFISGFIPIFISESLNNLSVYSILLPLMFYQVYCVLNLRTHLKRFIFLSFILPILHPFSFLLSLALLFYVILLKLESIRVNKLTSEALIFYVLLSMLISFIVYKKAFLASGLLAVWQNIPLALLTSYFKDINVLALIYNIGFIPLILGITGILIGLFREKSKQVYFLSAIILANFILLFLRLIDFYVGMMVLGIMLAIISALSIEKFIGYINMTKFVKYKMHIFFASLALIVLTMVVPSYFNADAVISNTISKEEVAALQWLNSNAEEGSTVLAGIQEGHYLTLFANRSNVADSRFISAPDRYSDMEEMITTESQVNALQLMDRHDVDYIYLSERTKKAENVDHLKYIDKRCFKKAYENEKAEIYKVVC